MERILNFSVVMGLCTAVCVVISCCGYMSDLLGYTFLATFSLSVLGFLVYGVYALTMWIKRTSRRIHRKRWAKQLQRELHYIAEELERLRYETESFVLKRNPIFGTFTSDEFNALHDERQSYIDESRHIIDECVRVYDRINACEADAMRYFDSHASKEDRKEVKNSFSFFKGLASLYSDGINKAVMLSTTTTIVG